jgi:TRAP-type mannitol/chloroaromatic compound transport system permease large subunit
VLIVLADQLGRSVGDMYAGALIPGLMLVGLYLLFIAVVAIVLPKWVPALPKEARIFTEANGATGHRSLLLLLLICGAATWLWSINHQAIINPLIERQTDAGGDEVLIMSITVGSFLALALALVNRLFSLGLLSRLAEQVTFVLIPPLVLIFLVLGTIFLGIATPTEGGAMGAVGAFIMAASRRALSLKLLKEALESSTRLSIFVLFILIGSTVFSFTFNAADGHVWVEHLFDKLPGGQLGFLLVVNFLVFVLGMFIDFFEIAFIVIPLLAPVAQSLDINLIWFGVLLAMNMQTSFLTPPFGFALFYLRSVAARQDYTDKVTGKLIPAVTTSQIYKGSIAFIVLQLVMVAVILFNPQLVTGSLDAPVKVDNEAVRDMLLDMAPPDEDAQAEEEEPAAEEGEPKPEAEEPAAEEDPAKALQDSLNNEKK